MVFYQDRVLLGLLILRTRTVVVVLKKAVTLEHLFTRCIRDTLMHTRFVKSCLMVFKTKLQD